MKKNILLFFLPFCLLAQGSYQETSISPETIEKELDAGEKEFKQAKELFNPWYAGPLLTGSAHMAAPGTVSMQFYLFNTLNYAAYNRHWRSTNQPNSFQLSPQINSIQTGITNWLDASLAVQGTANWSQGAVNGGMGDTIVSIGFPLSFESIHSPAIKLGITEYFPTGKYDGLDPINNGTDATGAGSYQTSFSLRFSKLFFWRTRHPLNFRTVIAYTLPTTVHVKNFNAYGGGNGTNGKVRPPNQLNISAGIEWSFTQKWVFASDFVYIHNSKTSFSGRQGTLNGLADPIGAPSNEQFSIAPALEYNPAPNLNFIGGVWLSLAGRNSANFISGILSVAYTFKVK